MRHYVVHGPGQSSSLRGAGIASRWSTGSRFASGRQGGERDGTTITNDTNEATNLLKINDRKWKSWNEAKKYLKTREFLKINANKAEKLLKINQIASSKAATFGVFCARFPAKLGLKAAKQRILRKTKLRLSARSRGRAATTSRLHHSRAQFDG